MSNVDKKVLKQKPLTEAEMERLENYPIAQRVDLAALVTKRRQQAAEKPTTQQS